MRNIEDYPMEIEPGCYNDWRNDEIVDNNIKPDDMNALTNHNSRDDIDFMLEKNISYLLLAQAD